MAKKKKEEVVEKTTDKAVETKMATDDGKLKVKKKPSMKSIKASDDEPVKVDLTKPVEADEKSVEEPKEEPKDTKKED